MGLIVSCSPKSESTKFEDLRKTQFEYTARNEDKELVSALPRNFEINKVTGLDSAQKNNTPWLENSVELFKLAENSLDIGDRVQGATRIEYKKFGHDLLRLFYQSKENSTQFEKNQTMYLPAALGFEGKRIKSVFVELATGENMNGAKNTFSTHHIRWPDTQPTLRPVEFIKSIKSYLLGVAPQFEKNGVSSSFTRTFSAQLDKDYIQALNNAEQRLQNIDQNQYLKINANVISEVIKTLSFIPPEAISSLAGNLEKAKDYAALIEKKHSSNVSHVERLVKAISNIWLDLTPQQREKYIKPANEMLYGKLNDFSDKLLGWLAGRTELSYSDLEYFYGGVYKNRFIAGLNASCHPEVYSKLNAWVSMNETQKAEFRLKNPDLFSIFSRYSLNEIRSEILNKYADKEFDEPLAGGGTVEKFITDVQPLCISRIQALLDKSISLYLLSELDSQIRTWGSMIEKVVADKTLQNLDQIAAALRTDDQFKQYFEKMAYPIMEKMLFEAGSINGIENSKVQLFVDSQNQFRTVRQNTSSFDSGAEVLGTSLAAQYRRLQGMSEFENKSIISKDYYRVVFSQINKMLSMIGFRSMENNLIPSLNRSFAGDQPNFDVYKYECSAEKAQVQEEKMARYNEALKNGKTPRADDYVDIKEDCHGYESFHRSLFEIPEEMTMTSPFTVGSYTKFSSIKSQSEIIRGAAYMLNYFNDWRGLNDFDAGMGKEAFAEITIFPKSALVNLAVATMTTPIRGLQKEGSALKLFNVLGNEIENWAQNGIPDPSQKNPNSPVDPHSQIIQAAIVNLLSSGPSHVVRTEDMAYFMVAVDEFLKATDGIEMTKASVLNPPQKVVKENMEAISKGRRLLKLMMFAMSNFLVSRVQDADGGFWAEYNLDSKQIVRKNIPRTLELQLTVIDALTRVYEQWGSEGALVSAVESYYFMNQKLWNAETSFYRLDESEKSFEVRPDLYLKAVLNFKKIEPYLNTTLSANQAKTLFDYYSKEFLKWNESSKPMSTQLN